MSGADGTSAPTVSDRNAQGWAIGYSVAGEVVGVGEGITDLASGDLVAAAGAGQANHADFVSVPRNLVCRVPSGGDLKQAASATIGAIALQGVRRAAPQLSDRACVIGLGLIGQITVQLLKAAGCRVIGFDLDAARVDRWTLTLVMYRLLVCGDTCEVSDRCMQRAETAALVSEAEGRA